MLATQKGRSMPAGIAWRRWGRAMGGDDSRGGKIKTGFHRRGTEDSERKGRVRMMAKDAQPKIAVPREGVWAGVVVFRGVRLCGRSVKAAALPRSGYTRPPHSRMGETMKVGAIVVTVGLCV